MHDMTGARMMFMRETDRRCRPAILGACAAIVALFAVNAAEGAFFDTAGKSARPMGMGEVFLASTGDASGYWYNPAGLSKFEKKSAGLSYGLPMAAISDLSISQVTFVTPLSGNMGLGLGVSYGGIDVANDMVISAGYGYAFSERLSIGGNAKIMRWSVDGQPIRGGAGKDDDLSKTSFSLDLSATMGIGELFGLGMFSTGVFVKDAIMPNISESGDDGGKLPVEAGIGLMMQRGSFLGEFDVAAKDGNTIFRLGGEALVPNSNLKLRAGGIYGSDFEDDTEKFDIDFGLGYSFGKIAFNYAYNIPVEIKSSSGKHFFSFGMSF